MHTLEIYFRVAECETTQVERFHNDIDLHNALNKSVIPDQMSIDMLVWRMAKEDGEFWQISTNTDLPVATYNPGRMFVWTGQDCLEMANWLFEQYLTAGQFERAAEKQTMSKGEKLRKMKNKIANDAEAASHDGIKLEEVTANDFVPEVNDDSYGRFRKQFLPNIEADLRSYLLNSASALRKIADNLEDRSNSV